MTRLSEASDDEMRALTGTSGVLCDTCGSTGHNTAGHRSVPSAAQDQEDWISDRAFVLVLVAALLFWLAVAVGIAWGLMQLV